MKQQPVNVQEELDKRVVVKIVSSRGHDEHNDYPMDAIERIKDQCSNHGKWCYIDGIQMTPTKITEDTLVGAGDITLTNALVGG